MKIVRMKVEYQTNPLGIDEAAPVFSWNVETEEKNWKQEGYQILVADSEAALTEDKGTMWDSGKMTSNAMVNIVYQGKALASATKYYWKVKVYAEGKESAYSETATFETAFFDLALFEGKWIGETESEQHHIYRRTFDAEKKIVKAI